MVSDETENKTPDVAEEDVARQAIQDEENVAAPPSTAEAVTDDAPPARARTSPRRRPMTRIVFLVFGLLVALYLGTQGPKEQHVRIVLGTGAPEVTNVDLEYMSSDGKEIVREAHFTYPKGSAPRVVAHEPQLPNGDYRLQIELDTLDGRRAVQRQVTLGGGSTQVDVSSALAREKP